MDTKKRGRPISAEKFIKTQISFEEKMYEQLQELSDKKGIHNLSAIVRIACKEYIEKEDLDKQSN